MFNNPLQMILIGMAMLCIGFVLLRGGRRLQKSRGRNLLEESKQDLIRTEQTVESRIHKMEVRLLEYQRTVEGHVTTKMETLQQLILSAEKQISRLEAVTANDDESSDKPNVKRQKSRHSMMIRILSLAGFSVDEIACMVKISTEEVDILVHENAESESNSKNNQVA